MHWDLNHKRHCEFRVRGLFVVFVVSGKAMGSGALSGGRVQVEPN